jgi:septum formation protein
MSYLNQSNQTSRRAIQPPFILASQSPQRKLLLETLGIEPIILPCQYTERPHGHLNPEDRVKQLAMDKYQQCTTQLGDQRSLQVAQSWVLTADTLVFLDSQHLGKPENLDQAREFLELLAGKVHEVITGVVLRGPTVDPYQSSDHLTDLATNHPKPFFHFAQKTQVEFLPLTKNQITWYLGTQEWQQAAGGYRIQGAGAGLVRTLTGSHTNVIGLPLAEIYGILSTHKFWI